MNHDDERIYPCVQCGKMRTKAEGGTVFTVCDVCWDRNVTTHTEKTYTRSEVLAFGERVREACAKTIDEKADWHPGGASGAVLPAKASAVVRAVDVARLLEEK